MKNLGVLFFVVVCNLWLLLIMTNYSSDTLFTNNYNNINNNNFVIHGEWKPGRRHKQTCQFIEEEKCCTSKQKNLHFEFYNKHLNKINAVEELRKVLKNKKLLLIGDSLMLEFFRGLAELLHVKSPVERAVNYSGSIYPPEGGTVTFLGAGVILLEGRKGFAAIERFRITSEETIRKKIADHDIVFFNQGLHYANKILLNDSIVYFNNMGEMLHGKDV